MGQVPPSTLAVISLLEAGYAVEDGRLWLATIPQALEDFLARPRGERGLASTDAFRAAAAKANPAAGLFLYEAPGPLLPALWNILLEAAHVAEAPLRSEGVPLDTALLPRGGTLRKLLTAGTTDLAIDAAGVALRSRATAAGLDLTTAAIVAATIAAVPELARAAERFGYEAIATAIAANERQAVAALRRIAEAQERHRAAKAGFASSLDALAPFLPDGTLAGGRHFGYRFWIVQGGDRQWAARAVPIAPNESGLNSYFIDERGKIRFSPLPSVDRESPACE
jgi:hypothetical protein